jgi:hypothetical protein
MSNVVYSDRVLDMLRSRKIYCERYERDAYSYLVDKMTFKQLNQWQRGKLKTKSKELQSLAQRHQDALVQSRAAYSAYSYYLDRMPMEGVAS